MGIRKVIARQNIEMNSPLQFTILIYLFIKSFNPQTSMDRLLRKELKCEIRSDG